MLRTEVLTIMAHLVITLTIVGIYGYTVAIGKPDTTLQNLLLIIGGFWFGAMGLTKGKKQDDGKGEGQ